MMQACRLLGAERLDVVVGRTAEAALMRASDAFWMVGNLHRPLLALAALPHDWIHRFH